MFNKKNATAKLMATVFMLLGMGATVVNAADAVSATETTEQISVSEDGEADDDVNLTSGAAADFLQTLAEINEDVNTQSTADEEDSEEDAEASSDYDWSDKVMADVEESLNIRKKADGESKVIGKLYAGAVATVIEVGDEWTYIESGDVKGYISNDYCVYGDNAEALAGEICDTVAKVKTDGLRVRAEADEEAQVLGVVDKGDKLVVRTKAKETDGWVAVKYNGEKAYVSADYVKVKLDLGEAITIEEEQARIAAEKAAAEAAEAAEAAVQSGDTSTTVSTTQNEAVSASTDDTTLLGAIIYIEAGGSSYEGKLAVGAVVMNRVRSGSYPNTISGVIYQSGQFATGSLSSVIANGVPSSCISAAKEAISGTDNTGGCLSFRASSSGYSGTVIGDNVFF